MKRKAGYLIARGHCTANLRVCRMSGLFHAPRLNTACYAGGAFRLRPLFEL